MRTDDYMTRYDFSFGFTTWWQMVFGGLWAMGVVISAAYLLLGILQIRKMSVAGGCGDAVPERVKTHTVWAGAALASLLISGAVLWVVSTVFFN